VTSLLNYNVVKVEASHTSACVTDQGDLFLWGTGVFGDYPFPQKIITISNPVIDISLG